METKQYRCLGLKANIEVPSSIEEYDKMANKSGACLGDAIDNVIYRNTLTGIRADFCAKLEEKSGIARKTVSTGKKRKVTVIEDGKSVEREEEIVAFDESEAKYVARVQAAEGLNDDAFVAKYQSLMDEVVSATATDESTGATYKVNAFDPTETERKPAQPKKLAACYIETATRVFANGNQAKIATRIKDESNTLVSFVDEPADTASDEFKAARAKNIELLGWAIKANEAFKERERQQQYA
jgi:hypothetical protein